MYTKSGIGYALRPPTGLPQARNRIRRGAGRLGDIGQAAASALAPGGCLLEDAPLGCAPSGIPWQATGGGPANNWQYYDAITGQPLDLDNACYINDDLLINCSDNQNGQQAAGPISILAQTPAYAAAVAAANAAYVPPTTPPPGYTITPPNLAPPTVGTGNPIAGTGTPSAGITPGTTVNGQTTGTAAVATCGGLGIGPCIGPLDAGTWGLIAAGVALFLMMGKK